MCVWIRGAPVVVYFSSCTVCCCLLFLMYCLLFTFPHVLFVVVDFSLCTVCCCLLLFLLFSYLHSRVREFSPPTPVSPPPALPSSSLPCPHQATPLTPPTITSYHTPLLSALDLSSALLRKCAIVSNFPFFSEHKI